MPEDKENQEIVFDAFLSYSRKDVQFAAKLDKALEAYRPPKDLNVPQRNLKIFRDEGDLIGTEYYEAIERHLRQCNKLIVVCSPDARKSEYVNDEIRRWVKLKGPTGIIPVLLQGIPNNEAKGDQETHKAFPSALYEEIYQKEHKVLLALSFLGIDLKREKIHKGKYEGSWYTLLANIYGLPREEIEQRDRRAQAKKRNVVLVLVSALAVVFAGISIFAWLQMNQAQRQAERAREAAIQTSSDALLEKDPTLGVLVLTNLDSTRIPRGGLQTAFELQKKPVARQVFQRHTDRVNQARYSPDGQFIVTASDDQTARVWRVGWKSLLQTLRERTILCLTKAQRPRYLFEDDSVAQERYEACERRYGRLK